jgi:hypothetical protein
MSARRTADIARRTTPELSPSVTERVHLPQNAAVDYCGQLIETLSTAHGRLYAEQVTRSAIPRCGQRASDKRARDFGNRQRRALASFRSPAYGLNCAA